MSGQDLCERFGVSRTAVWKAVESLKAEGYPVVAVRNRGYKLLETSVDVYSLQELKTRIHTKWVGKNALFFEEIGSTNIEAKVQAENGAEEGLLVVADQQTRGRGRRGRSWESPKGINIYFSLMLKPQIHPNQAPMITLLMALAVAKGMERMQVDLQESGLDNSKLHRENKNASGIGIKWPNDIVIHGKKVCGMLTEMSLEQDFIQNVVIGTGINVKRQSFPEEIAKTAISLEEAWNVTIPRCQLIGYIMEVFEEIYEDFLKVGNLSCIKDSYEQYLVNNNQEVRVLDPAGEYEGIARGINEEGELLVEVATANGARELREVYAGEVSVRGIYGYV